MGNSASSRRPKGLLCGAMSITSTSMKAVLKARMRKSAILMLQLTTLTRGCTLGATCTSTSMMASSTSMLR